jgi:hypothetical protein
MGPRVTHFVRIESRTTPVLAALHSGADIIKL